MPIPGRSLVGLLSDPAVAVPLVQQACVIPDPAAALATWQTAVGRQAARTPQAAPMVQPLPATCQGHLSAVAMQPRFGQTFAGQTIEFQLVEIAPLLACQVQVAEMVSPIQVGRAQPGADVPTDLLELCLPSHLKEAEPHWSRQGDENMGSVSFHCEDFEFRILQAGVSNPDPVTAMQMVGINVGMGIGLVHVIRSAGRHYLANGFHRVVNLLLAGHQYVPCMVRELDPTINLPFIIGQQVGVALSQARPPATCGDFLLAETLPLRKSHKVVNLSWSQMTVPDE